MVFFNQENTASAAFGPRGRLGRMERTGRVTLEGPGRTLKEGRQGAHHRA